MNTAVLPPDPAHQSHYADDRFEGFFYLTPSVASRYPRGIWLARNTRWLVSPPDVAIDHLFPPYTPEKNAALTQWFEY